MPDQTPPTPDQPGPDPRHLGEPRRAETLSEVAGEMPRDVQELLDQLAVVALDAAADQLSEEGMLPPFAAVVGTDGQTGLYRVDTSEVPDDEEVDSAVVIGQLLDLGREQAPQLQAFALCFVGELEEGGTAIVVRLEHRDADEALELLQHVLVQETAEGETWSLSDQVGVGPGPRAVWGGPEERQDGVGV